MTMVLGLNTRHLPMAMVAKNDSLSLFAHGFNQKHKLKPNIMFDLTFLNYSLLVQIVVV